MVAMQTVTDTLKSKFDGMEVDLEKMANGRITGHVVWSGFSGKDHFERQTEIRTWLSERLGEDAQDIGILLAFTPQEVEAMEAA
jgi:hypothetical protein